MTPLSNTLIAYFVGGAVGAVIGAILIEIIRKIASVAKVLFQEPSFSNPQKIKNPEILKL